MTTAVPVVEHTPFREPCFFLSKVITGTVSVAHVLKACNHGVCCTGQQAIRHCSVVLKPFGGGALRKLTIGTLPACTWAFSALQRLTS